MDELLLDKIKEILESEPLDLYDPDTETASESIYELIDPREQEDETDNRYVGSANLFIASTFAFFVLFKNAEIEKATDEELEEFSVLWKEIVSKLIEHKFIRSHSSHARKGIKLVINNGESPTGTP